MSQIEQIGPTRPEWTFLDRLVKARRHANLTQAQLAGRLGLGLKTLQRYELGTAEPKPGMVVGWAFACGVDPHWLIHGDEPQGPDDGQSITSSTTPWEPCDMSTDICCDLELQLVA